MTNLPEAGRMGHPYRYSEFKVMPPAWCHKEINISLSLVLLRRISVSLHTHRHISRLWNHNLGSHSCVLFLSMFLDTGFSVACSYNIYFHSLRPILPKLFLQTYGENKVSFEILHLHFCIKFTLHMITNDLSKIQVWPYLCLKSCKAPHLFQEKLWILSHDLQSLA